MKIVIKRILAFILSAIAVVLSLTVCSVVCNHPSEDIENTISSFYREPVGSLDVVMIGSSAAGTDFFPSVLWKEEKITSYCLFIDGCTADIYTSVLKEVISRQPQATILVDVDGLIAEDDFENEKAPIRFWVDSMPKNRNWYETINKLCFDTRWERYFPFSRYHRNMTSLYTYIPLTYRLLKKEILDIRDPMKGAVANNVKSAEALLSLNIKDLAPAPLTAAKEKYFDELIGFCKENSLENVMFVDLPKKYLGEEKQRRNTIYGQRTLYIRQEVEKYGYTLYSYNELDNPAYLKTDDYANSLHLSKSGGIKFSKYFAGYLINTIELKEKSEELILQWDNDTKNALSDYA